MATTLEMTLWSWAQHSLTNHLYDNAIFLAERLCAEAPSEPSRLLLANAYYASDQPSRACTILAGCSSAENRYLLALCQMKLGRTAEAQRALLGSAAAAADPDATAAVPNGAAGLYLLGTICLRLQPAHAERARAIKYFSRALELNPFLWSAYEALAQLGAPLPAAPPNSLPANPVPYYLSCVMPGTGGKGGAAGGGEGSSAAGMASAGLSVTGAYSQPPALPPGGVVDAAGGCCCGPVAFGGGGGSGTPIRPMDASLFSPAASPLSGILPPGYGFHPGSMPPPPCNHGQPPR
eukprot:scaffold24260_cov126-Isochrysis_galbana.AAC.13